MASLTLLHACCGLSKLSNARAMPELCPHSGRLFDVSIAPPSSTLATTSTMQRLPLVDDVFAHIFSCLDPSLCKSPDEVTLLQATLASSARSFRALTAHAIKVLWKELHSNRPLKSLLSVLELARCGPGDSELFSLVNDCLFSGRLWLTLSPYPHY